MKVGPIETKLPGAAPADRKAANAPVKTAAAPSAEVALSPAAQASLGKVDSDPTFDSAKVDRIAGAIRDGKFKINAEAIAEKLIVNAEELLGKKFN